MMMQKSFDSLPSCPDINEVITLEKVKIYIVGDRSYFTYPKAAAPDSRIAGYANTKNEIHVFGRRLGDKIVVNQAVLGHELMHLLNFKNSEIADPDRLEHLEARSSTPSTETGSWRTFRNRMESAKN